jgi:predicted AAA+ superfamily ATPase
MFARTCKIPKNNSFFLFGARGTGKTSLLRDQIIGDNLLWLDLLDRRIEDRYALTPDLLYEECKAKSRLHSGSGTSASDHQRKSFDWVVIDEIQKNPRLLDTVHRIIESQEFVPPKFALTGSSARKLRHGGANLLAGRAFVRNLYPLTHRELGDDFELDRILAYGSLPKIFSCSDDAERADFLTSYGLTYLNEEVWAEHLIQDLDPFRKFLEIAAQSNGKVVNFANIARDVNAHEKTVKKYFQILEDTLLGFYLEPYHRSLRKRQISSPKFFLFDTGVKRALERTLRQELVPSTATFGAAFEHLVISEAIRLNDYNQKDFRFSYFLSKDGGEIDLVIDRPGQPTALVEIKSSRRTDEFKTRYLRSLAPSLDKSESFCLSMDPHERIQDGINYLPWQKGLVELGL